MTEVELCNLALLRIGQRDLITSLAGTSAPARACAVLYPIARDFMLASYAWPFATRRLALTAYDYDMDPDFERSGWGYSYTLPTDYLAAQYIWSGVRNPAFDARTPFAVEGNTATGTPDVLTPFILTDQEDAELVYTAAITDTTQFPALFCDALAWKLAAELALALAVKPQLAGMMLQGLERSMAMAINAELRSSQSDLNPEAEWIRGR